MTAPILATKLFIPPSRPKFITRSHLIDRLNEGLQHKLTLISAPVGYGKTTLVSEWLSTLNFRSAWLSLDPEDDEPRRFWEYVVAALQTIQPELGLTILGMLQAPQLPPIENILSELINQITALSEKIILVLDDYHLMASSSLDQGINFLLDHLPVQMHLVIITREDPPFPLPQLRAKGQMVELRIKDLRFTLEESDQFLNHKMGLNLQPEEITVLGRRTEGWVAGLQMAALSLHELEDTAGFIEAFAGDNRYVADYLISEVLETQPDRIRDFLLKTAILDRFTPSLCDALIADGSQQSGKIIEQIEALGLFVIPLDHVRQWYRYHQLFADLLRYRLRQHDPSGFTELYQVASRWCQKQALVEEAVKYALAGEDYDYAADLIEKSGLTLLGRNQLVAIQNWISLLPERVIQQHPYLSILLVWVGSLTGQNDLVKRHLALAEENIASTPADQQSEIRCHIALLGAYTTRNMGDLDSSIIYAQNAHKYLPANNIFLDCAIHLNLGGNYWLNGNFPSVDEPLERALSYINIPEVEYPALAAAGFLANTYLQCGRLRSAEVLCAEIVERYKRHVHPAAAYVYLEQGELLYERNDLEAALEILTRVIQIGETADKVVNVIRARLLLARIHQILGNPEKVTDLMEQAAGLFQQSNYRHQAMRKMEYDYYNVRCLLFQSNMRNALRWAQEYEKKRDEIKNPWAVLIELIYAHVMLADGRPEQALPILNKAEGSARSSGVGGWVIHALILQSLCHFAMKDPEKALEPLQIALGLAEPEGYLRAFIDYGESMQELLAVALAQEITPGYVANLLAAFPTEAGEIKKPLGRTVNQSLIEPLTDQELGILRLMAAGLTLHEIASELYLSINTVKWHSTHIHGKLGVHRRAHAVARAREIGIL